MDNKIFCPNVPLTDAPLWRVPEPLLSLLDKPKDEHIKEVSAILNKAFYSTLHIFTDGSKEPVSQKVVIGVYIPKFKKENELPDKCAAKDATGKSDIDMKVNYSKTEMKFLIKQLVKINNGRKNGFITSKEVWVKAE